MAMAVPNPEQGTPDPHTDPGADRKQEILDFVDDFTIETTPGSALKIPDYRDHLRPGATVSVTFLPGSDFADTVTTAKRLKDEGFKPAPHFAARSIPSRAAFEANLKRLQDEVGVEEVVALGGAVNNPVGEYDSSLQLLETGLFDKYGVKRIGLAGHPEGSPDISDKGLAEALTWKNAFAERSDAEFYLATQFCFEAAPIIAWDRAIRHAGNRLPIHIGIPGLATLKTLINHAKACGIGPSMRILTRQAKNITKLLNVKAPDRLVSELAYYRANDPDCGIRRVHVYPLGGLRRSAQWIYAVADGEFTLGKDGRSFTIDRDIE
jgi:methylenetetrahydrofolate reductase (NADPH)